MDQDVTFARDVRPLFGDRDVTSDANLPALGERPFVTREPDPQQPHSGEVGIEIAPLVDAGSVDAGLADQIDALLRRACKLARAMTGAEQSVVKLWVGGDPTKARKYYSLSARYSAFSEFRVDPQGIGLRGRREHARPAAVIRQERRPELRRVG